MTQPVQEPTQGREDSGQGYRTRQLFRRPPLVTPDEVGIQFDIENDGGFLKVITTDYIQMHAATTAEMTADDSAEIGCNSNDVTAYPDRIDLSALQGDIRLITSNSHSILISLNVGTGVAGSITVGSAHGGGSDIFRIDADGSIHGLASVGAITWDL